MTSRTLTPDSRWLLPLLAALAALGPLTVDMYLPAMPTMRDALNTSAGNIQLTLSAYLAGFSIFHLACGPLADRFGRKPVIQGGTLLFVAASLGCALAQSVEQLLLFRFLQGVGACVGPTLARAIARDLFGPRKAARALSLIAMLMALAPAVAPTAGGLMLLVLPWQSIFVFLAGYGGLMLWLQGRYLAESLPQPQSMAPRAILGNYSRLLTAPGFIVVVIASSLSYAGMMVYLASASFVYMEMLGVPVAWFGAVFLTTVIGYMLGSALSARLAGYMESWPLVLLGALLAAIACLSMSALAWAFPESISAIMLPAMLYTAALGLVLPHAMGIALQPWPHMAGTASSLMGFIQMGVSALAAASVGPFLRDSPFPMLAAMTGLSLLGLLLSLLGRHLTRNDPVADPGETT
ncbi:multidrug effflux MFS transporter [Haliea atlantica]